MMKWLFRPLDRYVTRIQDNRLQVGPLKPTNA